MIVNVVAYWVYLFCCFTLSISLLAGCSTISSEEFAVLQGSMAREQQRQRELLKRVDALARFQEAIQGPQANMLVEMDAIRQELAKVHGRLDEEVVHRGFPDAIFKIEQRLNRVESTLGLVSTNTPHVSSGGITKQNVPIADLGEEKSSKNDSEKKLEISSQNITALFVLGQRLYKQRDYQSAYNHLEEFLKRYPKDKRIDEIQFMIGDILYSEKKYEEAILAFNQLAESHPESVFIPIALLKEGMSFADLGDKRTAKIVLSKLIKTYPNSNEAKQAEKLIAKTIPAGALR